MVRPTRIGWSSPLGSEEGGSSEFCLGRARCFWPATSATHLGDIVRGELGISKLAPPLPVRCMSRCLAPPTRDTRSRRRPPPRQTDHTESVLPRLQIMGSAVSDPPLRSCQARIRIRRIVDEDLSRSVELPRSPHSGPHDSRPPSHHRCRPGCGPSDLRFPIPQPRELEHTFPVQRFER